MLPGSEVARNDRVDQTIALAATGWIKRAATSAPLL